MIKEMNRNKLAWRVLRALYRIAPFNLAGDLGNCPLTPVPGKISCLLITSRRHVELDNLLADLSRQTWPRDRFEVVIVNDGANPLIREAVDRHRGAIDIVYRELDVAQRRLSNLRNISARMGEGEYFLFLDDDTRIFQRDFLERAVTILEAHPQMEVLLPAAKALYGIVKNKFDFLDTYSVTNRGSLYRRTALERIGGYSKDLNTYEDTEMSIRMAIAQLRTYCTDELEYLHPPLYFDSLSKPLAIGQTIFQMRRHYSFLVWLAAYINAMRFLVYIFFPTKINRQWLKISVGVLLFPFTRKSYYY